MRGAFIECRDELVTRLLDLRSPRMAKVLKCLKDDGCEVTGNVTDLYRRTIAAENRTSTALTWSPSPPVDLGTVNLSFELAISDVPRQSSPDEFQADRVASWAAPLGPHFNIGPDWSMNPHDISVRIPADAIRDLELPLVWSDEVKGTPGMMKKIVVSKARSFFDGKELQDPGGCKTMCCFLCPWCWGCTKQMAVLGTVGIEVPGTAAACIVVSGAPAGSDDLAICKEALAAAGFAQNDAGVYTLTLSTAG